MLVSPRRPPADPSYLEILGVRVARLERETALAEIERLYASPEPAMAAFVNAHTLNSACSTAALRSALDAASLVLNDGIGLEIAARLKGSAFPHNLNGSDFTPHVLTLAAERGWPVYLLGSAPGVADAAASRLCERHPGLGIVGCHHGFFSDEESPAVVERIRASGCGLLLAAMGNPRQEVWLARHLSEARARLGIGVGAFLDFAAGSVPRAPATLNRLGCEWVYRLVHEPRRLWRRYVIGNPVFLARVAAERLAAEPAR